MNSTRERERILDELYEKYAKGGTRFAAFRGMLYFYYKKYSWITFIGSLYFFKRLLDIAGSSVLLITLSPLFLVTAFSIRVEDRGPVFFRQTRIGKWGKPFTMLKFRSMVVNAEKLKDSLLGKNESGGVIFKMKHDPRVTRTGRIIRKLSIDELPQLWNVLCGDMSLVGPRPPVPREVAEYEYSDRRRLDVIPGITCISQISGRSELSFAQQVRLDVQYIENQSLLGDIRILFRTIPVVLLGKGAY